MEPMRADRVAARRFSSFLLIFFGVLSILLGLLWTRWLLYDQLHTFTYVLSESESYPFYDRLPSTLDVLPILPLTYLAIGTVTIGSVLSRRVWQRILLPSLSLGLVATYVSSWFGPAGSQGWPIHWLFYPVFGPLSPFYIVIPAFLADWAIFSLGSGLVFISMLRIMTVADWKKPSYGFSPQKFTQPLKGAAAELRQSVSKPS